ncbi:phosphonopyruvate decarboxylase [Orrella sp. 11846]|uniref:phosphonopyruvate decarboxylase n=1 Tax=Orrella sp. 11846 TaxID=3409913 RepID=UPI003B5B8393
MDVIVERQWQRDVYDLLRSNGVTQFAYVPDAGHIGLINSALNDEHAHAVSLTTEEEGIGLLAGADLGGTRGVLLMQSSGVGNCANLLSLVSLGRFPFLTLVSMRGDFGEGNPWQYPAGKAVEPIFHAMGVKTIRADCENEVSSIVDAAITQAFQGGCPTAVLLTQRLLGAKAF